MIWEYITHNVEIGGLFSTGEFNAKGLTDILNWYGTQQWELVSTFSTTGGNGNTTHIGLIFKRPKSAAVAPPVQPPSA